MPDFDGDTAQLILGEVAVGTPVEKSRLHYTEDMKRFRAEAEREWKSWKSKHSNADLYIPSELPRVDIPVDEKLVAGKGKIREADSEPRKDGLPRRSFAYTPTDNPSEWKLPYLNADGSVDARHLAAAAAAVSPGGFRGERADIPESALRSVKAKLRSAYRRLGKGEDEMPDSIRESVVPGYVIDMIAEEAMQPRYVIEALLEEREAELIEATDDDSHYHGAWYGGAKSSGGGPPGGGSGVATKPVAKPKGELGSDERARDVKARIDNLPIEAQRGGKTHGTHVEVTHYTSKGERRITSGRLQSKGDDSFEVRHQGTSADGKNRGQFVSVDIPYSRVSHVRRDPRGWVKTENGWQRRGGPSSRPARGKTLGGQRVTHSGQAGSGTVARVAVRPKTYQGREGFLISGTDALGRRVSIHTKTRDAADRIRKVLRDPALSGDDQFNRINKLLD